MSGAASPSPSLTASIIAHLSKRPGRTAALVALSIVTAAIAIIPPLLVARVVDAAVEGRAEVLSALMIVAAIAALAFGEAGLTLIRRQLALDTEITLREQDAAAHFNRVTRLPMRAYGGGNEAALIRSFDDLDTVVEFATGHAVDFCAQALIVASYVALMLAVEWRMALVFVVLAVVSLAHAAWHARRMQQAVNAWLPLRDRRFGFIVECITSVLTVKTLSAHTHLRLPFAREQAVEQDALREFRSRRNTGDAVSRFWTVATPGIGTGCGVVLLTAGELTAGGLVLFLSVSGSLVASLSVIHQNLQALHETRGSFERMQRVAGLAPEPLLDAPQPAPGASSVLAAEGITLRHPGADEDVLRDVTLAIRQGQHVAIVGPSGEGKTTLSQVLARLLEPQAGDVTVDGRTLDLDHHRRSVLVVPHTVAIFSASLRENVRLWDEEIDDAAVRNALRLAELERLAVDSPLGLDVPLGANGNPLSAGQRQRIGLARAFVRRPDTLILDEATSALDVATEQNVLRNVREHMRGKALLVVTHRVHVAESFAHVLHVHRGRIVPNDAAPSVEG